MAFKSLAETLPSAKTSGRKEPALRENRKPNLSSGDPNLMAMVERQRELKLKYNKMIKAEVARREGRSQGQEDESQEDEPRLVDIFDEQGNFLDKPRVARKKKPKFVSREVATERRRGLAAWRNRSLSVIVASDKGIGIKHATENCDLVRFQTRKLRTRQQIERAYDKLHDSAKELLKLYLWFSHSSRNTDGGWVSHRQNYIAACLARQMGRESYTARTIQRLNKTLHASGFLITLTSVNRVNDRLTGAIKVKPCVSKHYYYSVILKKKLNNLIDCDLDSSALLCDYIGVAQVNSNSPSSLFIKNKVTDTDNSLFGKDFGFRGKFSNVNQVDNGDASMTLKRGGVDKPKGKFVCYCRCGGCIFKNKGTYSYFYACSFNNASDEKRCFFWVTERELDDYFRFMKNKPDFKGGISEMINFYAKNKDLPLKSNLMPVTAAVELPAVQQPAVQQPAKTPFSLGSCRCGQPLFVVNKGLICSNYFFGCRMSGAVEYSAEAHDGSRISIGACKCRGELFIENLEISCSNAEYGCDRAKSAGARKALKPYIYMGNGRRCCRECGLEMTAGNKYGSFLRCQNQCISDFQQVASYVQGLCQGNVRICPGQKPHCETHNGECGSFLMSNLTFNNGRYDYEGYQQLGGRDRQLVHKWAEKLRANRIQKPKFEKVCCRVMKRICLGCPKFERKEDDVAPSIDNGCCLTLTNHKALEKELCYIAKPTIEGVCCPGCQKFMVECEQKYGMAYDCLQRHLEFEKEHTGTVSRYSKFFDQFVPSLVWETGQRYNKFLSEEERAKLPDLDNINVVLKICEMGEHYFSDEKYYPESRRTLADLERLKKEHAQNGKNYWLT